MGIYIYLSISASVTKQEWASVYEETLRLLRMLCSACFPSALKESGGVRLY